MNVDLNLVVNTVMTFVCTLTTIVLTERFVSKRYEAQRKRDEALALKKERQQILQDLLPFLQEEAVKIRSVVRGLERLNATLAVMHGRMPVDYTSKVFPCEAVLYTDYRAAFYVLNGIKSHLNRVHKNRLKTEYSQQEQQMDCEVLDELIQQFRRSLFDDED